MTEKEIEQAFEKWLEKRLEVSFNGELFTKFINYHCREWETFKAAFSLLLPVIEKLQASNEFYASPESWIHNGSATSSTVIAKSDFQANGLRAGNTLNEEPMGLKGKGDYIGGKLARQTQAEVSEMLKQVKGEG